jgi:hypothetical protein
MNDAGQIAAVDREHPQLFASAQDCYEVAGELYQAPHDAVVGISVLCSKQPEREA